MKDLFKDFGISPIQEEPFSEEDIGSNSLAELYELARQQAEKGQLIYVFNPSELRRSYLDKVLEVSRKRGRFTYICARCNKPINDAKKLVYDSSISLIYGVDCYNIIKRKQHNLQYVYYQDGSKRFAQHEEMEVFTCFVSGMEFKAVSSNVNHCGTTVRSCFMCPGTSLKFKNLPCDFERWLSEFVTKRRNK